LGAASQTPPVPLLGAQTQAELQRALEDTEASLRASTEKVGALEAQLATSTASAAAKEVELQQRAASMEELRAEIGKGDAAHAEELEQVRRQEASHQNVATLASEQRDETLREVERLSVMVSSIERDAAAETAEANAELSRLKAALEQQKTALAMQKDQQAEMQRVMLEESHDELARVRTAHAEEVDRLRKDFERTASSDDTSVERDSALREVDRLKMELLDMETRREEAEHLRCEAVREVELIREQLNASSADCQDMSREDIAT